MKMNLQAEPMLFRQVNIYSKVIYTFIILTFMLPPPYPRDQPQNQRPVSANKTQGKW